MSWVVEFHDDFEPEFDALPEEVQDELIARNGQPTPRFKFVPR